MKKQSFKNQIITELCHEKGIEKTDISYDWITILKKGNIEKKLVNCKLDVNSSISEKIANDKYSSYEVLKYYNIPTIEHKVLFNENIMTEYGFVNDKFKVLKNNEKVVIKVNDSSQGKDVFLCDSEKQKIEIVKKLFQRGEEAVSVCPYLEIEAEYRAFCVYGETEYIYKKQKPFVVGDGTSTLGELIAKHLKYLTEMPENVDLAYIPKKNEKVIVGWKHNLSQGAVPETIDENDTYYENVKEIAKQTADKIGLDLAAIDVIVTKQGEVLIMEVNPNFGVAKFCELVPEGYKIMKEMYSQVIDRIFEKGE